MRKKILIIDDDKRIATMIQDLLPPIEFQSKAARSADQALQELESFSPDLILMDIHLPGVSGFELCRIVKENPAWKKIPIIMVSGSAKATRDKVTGFQTGADDYIVKPFEPSEFMARVRALLRRTTQAGEPDAVLQAGALSIDLSRRSATLKNQPVKLTPKEFDLLTLFMQKKGRVLSRTFLLETVWGTDANISTRTVDVHIASLRSKLGDVGVCLHTESTIGYRFQE